MELRNSSPYFYLSFKYTEPASVGAKNEWAFPAGSKFSYLSLRLAFDLWINFETFFIWEEVNDVLILDLTISMLLWLFWKVIVYPNPSPTGTFIAAEDLGGSLLSLKIWLPN